MSPRCTFWKPLKTKWNFVKDSTEILLNDYIHIYVCLLHVRLSMKSKSKFVICYKQKDCVEIRGVMRALLRAYAFHLSSAPHTAHKFLMSHLGLVLCGYQAPTGSTPNTLYTRMSVLCFCFDVLRNHQIARLRFNDINRSTIKGTDNNNNN